MAKLYRAVVADPPWRFDDRGSRVAPDNAKCGRGYKTMDLEEIMDIKFSPADDSMLFLWVPSALLVEGVVRVLESWGFVLKQTVVWVKPVIGLGHYFRNAHEFVLVGTKGKAAKLVKDHSIPSWFMAPRGKHSEKPELLQDMVERLIDGPYLELFARRKRKGWTCIGDEL